MNKKLVNVVFFGIDFFPFFRYHAYMGEFVHLHVHSDNSLQDAAVSVMALADRAEELGMTHLALTDHGNMFGAMEFIAACKETLDDEGKHKKRKNPIQPIIGCEAYVSPGSRLEKTGSEGDNKYFHLVLLATNREGYFNLVKLCSYAYTEGFYYRPRIDDELLSQYKGGLIALSGCVSGEIPYLIQMGKTEEAEKKALFYRDLFGHDAEGNPNFYLEIQNHGIPSRVLKGALSQKQIYDEVIAISRRTGIPLAATNDIHYLNREDHVAHDILLCIGTGKTRTEEKRKKYYGAEFYFKSAEEMAELFSDVPESMENTATIARRCTTDIPRIEIKELPHYLPDFEIPPEFAGSGVTADNGDISGAYLRHLTFLGLEKRYKNEKENPEASAKWQEIQNRAHYELDIIIQMGFTGYFLIVADFINWAKDNGIEVGPGRGSGAGSITAYALRITDIDPLKYGLLFERFLNPERISMPDFDIDFCNERREEVISYVTEKYGKNRVGQIITFGTLGAKAVIKDVARALSISIPESDSISKLIPFSPKITLERAFEENPKLLEIENDPRYTELFSLARKLEGLKRHSSIHAAGIVIGKTDLSDYVPLYRDPKTGSTATQYTMGFLEDCGLVKMDFLGLKTLDVIKSTQDIIRKQGHADFSVDNIPDNDKTTFSMLAEGQSFEVFQFESEGMQNVLRQAKPTKIEDLIALNALYRPGPMANITQFTESKNGKRAIRYPHPKLENVLKETYGVIVYQEQVMQVARIIAGYSMGKADLLRRAMGKKKKEIIENEKVTFLEGAVKQGYSKDEASGIYDMLVPFADYGFNKSHAAAYSVLAYRTAWLKANYPMEFTAANLSNEINSADKDKLSECISEARRRGITVDPPDINKSDKLFTVVDGHIVFGFLGIKGIGSVPAEEIIKKRQDGPYTGFMDFLDKVNLQTNQPGETIVSRKVVELLIKTGAFDEFGVNRPTLLANMEAAVEYAQNKKNDAKFGQVSLFENTGETIISNFEFVQKPEMDRAERLAIEKELIGFYFSGHPLDAWKTLWEQNVTLDLSQENITPGNYILIGIVKSLNSHTDKTGKAMAFGTLEDYRGEMDLAFFGDVWSLYRDKIHQDDVIAVSGKVDVRRGKPSLQVAAVLASGDLTQEKINGLNAAGPSQKSNRSAASNMEALDKYREVWEQNMTLDLSAPEQGLSPAGVRIAEGGNHVLVGILASTRTHIVQKTQKEMAFGTLEDYRSEIDLVFFDRCWENNKDKLIEKTCIALKGKLDLSRDRPSFLVSSLLDLGKMRRAAQATAAATPPPAAQPPSTSAPPVTAPTAAAPATAATAMAATSGADPREVHIRLHDSAAGNENSLYPIRDYIVEHPGTAAVFIHIPPTIKHKETVVRSAIQLGFAAEEEHINALKKNPGVAEIWVA